MELSIAIVHGVFHPGGAQYVVLDFIRELQARGHTCTLFTLDIEDGLRKRVESLDVEIVEGPHPPEKIVHRLVDSVLALKYRWARKAWRPLLPTLEKFDVVLATHFWLGPSVLPQLSRPLKAVYLEEPPRFYYEDQRLEELGSEVVPYWVFQKMFTWPRRADRRAHEGADLILGNSFYTAARGRMIYPGVKRHVHCPIPVDGDRFEGRDEKWISRHLPDEAQGSFLLALGIVSHVKGTRDALEVLRRLRKDNPEMKLIWVGPDPRDLWESWVADVGVEGAARLEDLEMDQIVALYHAAVATIVTASREPFGLTVVESQLCGTPVVAYAEGGPLTTIEHRVSGLLVPAGNPAAMSAAISELIDDSELYDRIVAAASLSTERFSTRAWGDVFCDEIEWMLKQRVSS